jgi:pimeloyl-ACP methyl ester carboxylesterase
MLYGLLALLALMTAGVIYEKLSRQRDARRFPPLGRLVDVGGHRLHILCKGTEGPTVVIEQGAGGPSLTWLGLQQQISEFARVCVYDRAGYQWSNAVSLPRTIESRVKDLHSLLTEAGVPAPYVLVGHSYGGFLVRLFAREYPSQVAGLVLVDTPHELGYCRREVLSMYSKFRWVMRAMKQLSRFGLPRILTRLFAKPDPSLPPGISEQINAFMVRREYFAAASDDIASLQRATDWLVKPDAFSDLGDLPIAVITHGQPFPGPFAVLEKDWREGQERLAALSTNSVLVVAEKSNHMIHNDEPEIVIDAIGSVLVRARSRELIRAAG